ncbi:5-formyltetrahydrofolate cyclo-ligase [Oleidesulfovibrio sp.]|uniref:5-formyltetrahydrofolate cyclo-ligase n=1 Tax=Oleidesulfovibrio sp. TaxID=2909707 RepID=UPI003A8AC36F
MSKQHPDQNHEACAVCDKAALRRMLITKRTELSPSQIASYGARAQLHLLEHRSWQDARQVLLYMPVRNEVPTGALLKDAWARGIEVLLPRCIPQCDGEMCLAPCTCEGDLVAGRYGIAEPDPANCPAVDLESGSFSPDIAIIPGVGFDRSGTRLGFGAGYYDRFLSLPAMQSTLLIGLAYSFQVLPTLPSDPWDRPVTALCTEEALTWL